jgi:hypothetical protein
MNRLTHGCCSEKHVLPHEDPEEFAATIQFWFDEYLRVERENYDVAAMLVQETALAQWHFTRNRRRLEEFESKLPASASNWTSEHHKQFQNFTRYKASAERDFLRWFNLLEREYDREHRQAHLRELAQAKIAAAQMRWINNLERRMVDSFKIKQYIQVSTVDGKAVTKCYPENEQIAERLAKDTNPDAVMISRWIEFLHGVPPEYSWVDANFMQQGIGGVGVQKMPYRIWLSVVERELNSDHVGPIFETGP